MPVDCQKLLILDTQFGFFSLIFQASTVLHLSLGHVSRADIRRAFQDRRLAQFRAPLCEVSDPPNAAIFRLVDQLTRYTAGHREAFARVRIDSRGLTPFTLRVIAACQKIPYGQTVTYGELARSSGSPRGARSVGTVMAQNRFPLLVPCHRVVAAGGRLGGFSAAGGQGLKQQLLEMEAAASGKRLALAAE